VLLRNFHFVVREVRLTVLTRFSVRAVRSLRAIGRVGPSESGRDLASKSGIIVW
jgi:hypothetical protein